MKHLRAILCRPTAAILAMGCVSMLLIAFGHTSVANPPAPLEPDGTLHIRELTIPPSDFWSAEFKAVYSKMVTSAREAAAKPRPDPHPARDAPKAEWDKFDESLNARLAERLADVRARYPVEVTDTTIAGVRVGVIVPKENVGSSNKDRVLINLHGGGFVDFRGLSFGQLESIPVASLGGVKVVTVDYRQSPYFQYPAASEDVEAIYRALLKEYKPESIGIFGCSAGGVLAAQSVAWFQAKELPLPGAVGIFGYGLPTSPQQWKMGDSRMWGLGIPPGAVVSAKPATLASVRSEANSWYMQEVPDDDLVAYPGSSDQVLSEFPPTLFLSGTRELPMSLAVVAHARLLKLGVDSSLYLMEGAPHCAHVFAAGTPEAHDASAYIARWFDQRLAR
jgi:acetyl esterase/lipase